MALKKNWQSGDTVYGTDLNALASVADAAYKKPAGGIPESDLDVSVQTKLNTTGGPVSVSSEDITDATAVGKGLITAGTATAARTAIGAGTSSLTLGTSSSTACAGDDARLSNARTPTAHTHEVEDLAASGTPSSTTYLRGDGTWATPPGGGGGGVVSADDITDASTTGKAVIRAADAATARTAIGAGTSSLTLGTSSSTACAGDDARLSNARTPTAHTHSGVDITSGTVAYARLPVGSAASTVCAGNDARLSDARTPTDNSVTSAKIVDGTIVDGDISASAAIAVSKLGSGRVVGSSNGTAANLTLWKGTQAQYDAIGTKDANTIYVVTA